MPRRDPPYVRYAFANPYNLALLAGAAILALLASSLGVALCAAAAEAAWLLVAPESKLLRRVWFDRKWEAERAAAIAKATQAHVELLLPIDRPRVAVLLAWRDRVAVLATSDGSVAAAIVRGELGKLDALVDDFLALGATVARCEQHVGSFDFARMNASYASYKQSLDAVPAGDPRRDVAARNVE